MQFSIFRFLASLIFLSSLSLAASPSPIIVNTPEGKKLRYVQRSDWPQYQESIFDVFAKHPVDHYGMVKQRLRRENEKNICANLVYTIPFIEDVLSEKELAYYFSLTQSSWRYGVLSWMLFMGSLWLYLRTQEKWAKKDDPTLKDKMLCYLPPVLCFIVANASLLKAYSLFSERDRLAYQAEAKKGAFLVSGVPSYSQYLFIPSEY